MLTILENLQHLLVGAADSVWSLVMMGAFAMGDALIPPLPSGTVVSALAAASAKGTGDSHSLWLIIVVAAACALIGDLIMYGIGCLLHGRPLARLKSSRRLGPAIEACGDRFDSHWTVILGTARFIPVFRVGVFLAAGMFSVPLRRVVLMDGIAAFIWASVYASSGRFGGILASNPLVGTALGIAAGSLAGLAIAKAADWYQKSRFVDNAATARVKAANFSA